MWIFVVLKKNKKNHISYKSRSENAKNLFFLDFSGFFLLLLLLWGFHFNIISWLDFGSQGQMADYEKQALSMLEKELKSFGGGQQWGVVWKIWMSTWASHPTNHFLSWQCSFSPPPLIAWAVQDNCGWEMGKSASKIWFNLLTTPSSASPYLARKRGVRSDTQ